MTSAVRKLGNNNQTEEDCVTCELVGIEMYDKLV
jgi:hypothetical protein